MSYSLEEKIKNFAIISRLGIIWLQFFSNWLIPDHDAGVFIKPLQNRARSVDFLDFVFGGLTRWDGQYFLHIAHYGYTYENTLAFFPLFPLIIRVITHIILFILHHILEPILIMGGTNSFHNILVVVSVLFNFFIFIKTSTVFFRLSVIALKNEKLAFISAILFCVNPASIFFSAVYSEALYCFLVFYGLLQIEKKNSIINYLIIGMTGAVRSNGLINIGYIIYKYIKIKVSSNLSFFYNVAFNFGLFLTLAPFLAYQFYCYSKYCLIKKVFLPKFILDYGNSKDFVLPGKNSSWCNNTVPFAYAFVQKHYWNVGFLNYYELKQLPNFLLAFPMIFIMARGSYDFVKKYKSKLFYLGLITESPKDELPLSIFPYFLHGIALTVFSVLMVHVQVTTRLLASSSPMPYWFCARVLSSSMKNPVESEVLKKFKKKEKEFFYESRENKRSRWKTFLFTENFKGYSFFIKWYFLSYFFLGTVMFSNYLPWT